MVVRAVAGGHMRLLAPICTDSEARKGKADLLALFYPFYSIWDLSQWGVMAHIQGT